MKAKIIIGMLQKSILVLILLMTIQCVSQKKQKVNKLKNDNNFKNVRFDYFRTVIYADNVIAEQDTIYSLYISKNALVVKKGINGKDDTKYVFTSFYKTSNGMLWEAYFYGNKELVYIEYLKNKSVTIMYIKRKALIKFINVAQKSKYKPFPEKGKWYFNIPIFNEDN